MVRVHCFSHTIESALKDAFDTSPFGKIDNMLIKIYILICQKSPEWYRELKKLGKMYEKNPKPTKVSGTL